MTRYTRRHYEDCVTVIAKTHARHLNILGAAQADKTKMLTMVTIEQWAKEYRQDSDLFDQNRFVMAALKACQIDPMKVPLRYIPNGVADVLADELSKAEGQLETLYKALGMEP